MSVGIGVSDILYFVNQTLILYGQCMGAPAELQAAGRNVEQMRTALEILGEAIRDRKSFIAKQPAITLMIKHEMKPLKQDLLAMNVILNDYIDKSKNMGMIGRVRYAVMDRNRLQCIQSNLMKSRTNFGLMLDLINMKAQDEHARTDHLVMEKMSAILDKQIKEVEARKIEAKAREKGDVKLDNILQILEDRLSPATQFQDKGVTQSQVLDQLEKELRKVGLSQEKAQVARLNAAQALSEDRAAGPISTLLQPEKNSRGQRRSSDPSPKMGRAKPSSPSPSPRFASPKLISPRSLAEKTKDYRILCVDGSHGIRAILAHAYLELLRVWTGNRTGRWLFKRVHSAGLIIDTNPQTSLDPIAIQGIGQLLPPDEYEWALDSPHEVRRIAQRMKFYNPFRFLGTDLSTYDVILCFTRTDASLIAKFEAEHEDRARVIVLPGCREISSEDCAKDPKKIGELISNIKSAIKGFITQELGDWVDGAVKRTKSYRTLQLLLPGRDLNFAGTGDFLTDGDKIKEYESKSGCSIKVTKYKGSTKEILVSVIGPKDHLAKAAALMGSSARLQLPFS